MDLHQLRLSKKCMWLKETESFAKCVLERNQLDVNTSMNTMRRLLSEFMHSHNEYIDSLYNHNDCPDDEFFGPHDKYIEAAIKLSVKAAQVARDLASIRKISADHQVCSIDTLYVHLDAACISLFSDIRTFESMSDYDTTHDAIIMSPDADFVMPAVYCLEYMVEVASVTIVDDMFSASSYVIVPPVTIHSDSNIDCASIVPAKNPGAPPGYMSSLCQTPCASIAPSCQPTCAVRAPSCHPPRAVHAPSCQPLRHPSCHPAIPRHPSSCQTLTVPSDVTLADSGAHHHCCCQFMSTPYVPEVSDVSLVIGVT